MRQRERRRGETEVEVAVTSASTIGGGCRPCGGWHVVLMHKIPCPVPNPSPCPPFLPAIPARWAAKPSPTFPARARPPTNLQGVAHLPLLCAVLAVRAIHRILNLNLFFILILILIIVLGGSRALARAGQRRPLSRSQVPRPRRLARLAAAAVGRHGGCGAASRCSAALARRAHRQPPAARRRRTLPPAAAARHVVVLCRRRILFVCANTCRIVLERFPAFSQASCRLWGCPWPQYRHAWFW